jgi:GDPmannose 4,6-dehydratase
MGTLRLLEMLRDLSPFPKLLHISSSEIFGRPSTAPQDESTPLAPVTPYGVAKAFATNMVRVYREAFSMFACNAICYNHESPRRGESFVTRKVTRAAARIKVGLDQSLSLGNLDAARDWGFAGDYVEAMWRMLQQPDPGDYVLATGVTHSIRDLLATAFAVVGLDWQDYVKIDTKYQRPSEVADLRGNPEKARSVLRWQPAVDFQTMIRSMVLSDLEQANRTKVQP